MHHRPAVVHFAGGLTCTTPLPNVWPPSNTALKQQGSISTMMLRAMALPTINDNLKTIIIIIPLAKLLSSCLAACSNRIQQNVAVAFSMMILRAKAPPTINSFSHEAAFILSCSLLKLQTAKCGSDFAIPVVSTHSSICACEGAELSTKPAADRSTGRQTTDIQKQMALRIVLGYAIPDGAE